MKNKLNAFLQIVLREVSVFSKLLKSKILDLAIIVSTTVIVFSYLMPSFGLKAGYGAFIVVGVIPLIAFFEVIPRASTLVMDLTGDRKISYMLTLPLPSYLSIAAIPVGWSLCGSIYTIFVLPFAKLILLKSFDLSNLSFFKFIFSFLSINILFGFFALWLTSLIKEMKYMSWVWSRVVNPMFMLGGYFYTWKSLFSLSHAAAYVNLINPLLYSIEALRSAVFGPQGYINYWLCMLAIWIFAVFFAFWGILKIKKRLDCV
ncbi:MAG: ABC transporter permease [Parachlamydiales bacterium]|nr:ABC transporter permease [Parachlamydiales bacterium]